MNLSPTSSPNKTLTIQAEQLRKSRQEHEEKRQNFYLSTFGIDPALRKPNLDQKNKLAVILMPPDVHKPMNQNSNMYELFAGDQFTMGQLMGYYYTKFKDQGPHQFLTNKLYGVNQQELEFYIPQLCHLLIKNDSPYLEKFIVQLCSTDMALYQLISWCFIAFSDRDRQERKKMERILRIDGVIEQYMVNGKTEQNNIQQFFDKSKKLRYQQAIQLYLNNLIEMSLLLKTYKAEDRKPNLKNFISKANRALERYKAKNSEFYFCQGITVPFARAANGKVSNLIVRIIEGECTCFNTKKRVPYRIVVETIDPNELKIRQPKKLTSTQLQTTYSSSSLRSKDNLDDDSMENFLQNEVVDKEALKQMMQDIVNSKRGRDFGDLKKMTEQEGQEKKGTKLLQQIISTIQVAKKLNNQNNNVNDLNELEERAQNELNKKELITRTMNRRKSFLNAVDREKFEINLKRFGILFQSQAIERTQSCQPKLLNVYQQQGQRKDRKYWLNRYKNNTQNGWRHKHKIANDLTLYQRLVFFKEQIKNNDEKGIWLKMYYSLQYDLYEKKLEKQNISLNNAQQVELEIPKGFGPWDELWEDKSEVIKRNSPYSHFESYQLKPIIVKGGDDLRQELMTMQLIRKMQYAFQQNQLDLFVKPYEIIVVSASSGIIEFNSDTISIDGLKKKYPACKSLPIIYKQIFGYAFEEAQHKFIISLAAYSIIAYLLQIKDRHNGNMLIDSNGHIIHIDFGFILSSSPGKVNFESAPFKFTAEYVDMMNGYGSDLFRYFSNLMFRGFKALQEYVGELVLIVEMMMGESDLPCFEKFSLEVFRDRFQEKASDEDLMKYVDKLIHSSMNNWRTIQYDNFQRMTNGIMP